MSTLKDSGGVKPISEWGAECARGFVSNARFGSGRVIERTNRNATRKWRNEAGPAFQSIEEQQVLEPTSQGGQS